MPKFRFKGEVLLILGVVVLLATGVSNVPIPRAQASTQANTQALQTLVKDKDPGAIVFHLCHFHPKTSTQAASCPDWAGTYFYVHNVMALAELTEGESSAKVGHVTDWLKPETWDICTQDYILTHPQECKHGCPSHGAPSNCNTKEAYWVRDLTHGTYDKQVTIKNSAFPGGMQTVMVQKVPIAFKGDFNVGSKVESETHDAVFVCFLPAGTQKCETKIPSTTQGSAGTLYYEHYVNDVPDKGDYAPQKGAFKLKADASKTGKNIEAVDLRTQKFP